MKKADYKKSTFVLKTTSWGPRKLLAMKKKQVFPTKKKDDPSHRGRVERGQIKALQNREGGKLASLSCEGLSRKVRKEPGK